MTTTLPNQADHSAPYEQGGEPEIVEQPTTAIILRPSDALGVPAEQPPFTVIVGAHNSTLNNVLDALGGHPEWLGVVAFNEFNGEIELRREPPMLDDHRPPNYRPGSWTAVDTTRTRAWIGHNLACEVLPGTVESAIEVVARKNSFHPVRDWLDALEWDKTPRIDRLWADYFGATHDDYCAATGSKFMIGAVARIYQPGCKRDEMPIPEGPQGTGKSSAFAALFGADWFSDTGLKIGSKDAMAALHGKWCIEFAELASMKEAKVDELKAFLSSKTDRFRPAYGRHTIDYPRQCVFVGTVNPDGGGYLRDTTGNRRFWPVKCGAVSVAAIKRDRDQLWAEAVHRYRANEQWWLTPAEEALARVEQADRQAEDPWATRIVDWERTADIPNCLSDDEDGPPFALPARKPPKGWRQLGLTTGDILEMVFEIQPGKQTPREVSRLGEVLASIDWTKHRPRLPGIKYRPWRYLPPGQPSVNLGQPVATTAA